MVSIKCSLCGSTNVEIIDTKIRNNFIEEVKAYRCNICGVHFLFPYLNQQELETFYDGQYRTEYTYEDYYEVDKIKDFFNKSLPEAAMRLERVKPYIDKSNVALEIGCGSGYFLNTLSPFVRTACGTEWDQNNALYAKGLGFDVRKNPKDFNCKFDKIFMFHVLEHILDPAEFIKDIKMFLKPGATLFIEVPNNEDILVSGYDINEFKDFYYQSAHLWYFNKRSLAYVLEKAGCKYEIKGIQRYDLSNHIQWLKDKVPGGQGKYSNIFTDKLNKAYVEMLFETGKTDTLFAICSF